MYAGKMGDRVLRSLRAVWVNDGGCPEMQQNKQESAYSAFLIKCLLTIGVHG
jgi:hypothetical protein